MGLLIEPKLTLTQSSALRLSGQRLKLSGDGTGAIDQGTGSDEASITYA
ncbi:hypothetical protein AAII07_57105 [Microvirga sp. 0TCS3.31]